MSVTTTASFFFFLFQTHKKDDETDGLDEGAGLVDGELQVSITSGLMSSGLFYDLEFTGSE